MRTSLRSLALLAGLALPAAGQQTQTDNSFKWNGQIAAGNWVNVHNLNGTVTVGAATGSEVQVTATKRWRRGDPATVRIEAKKLRYAAEFFGPLFDNARKRRRCDRFIVALKRLQDELGALNDIAVTPMLLDKLGLIGEPGTSTLLGKSRHKRHLRAATDAYRDLIRAKRFWR